MSVVMLWENFPYSTVNPTQAFTLTHFFLFHTWELQVVDPSNVPEDNPPLRAARILKVSRRSAVIKCE